MREAGEAVGRGIASSAALLDLEAVAIGGGIALGAWDLIAEPLLQEVRLAARLDFTRDLRVVQAGLGEDAGLVGAAALAWIGLGRTLLG
jgi:glucokinase